MRRVFGLPTATFAAIVGLLAAVGIPSINSAAVASAASAAQQIGMKVLVITDSSNANAGIAYGDWVNTLQREGLPYTPVVTSSSHPGTVPLPALSATLGDGTQVANYQGVVVAVSGLMGLTNTQWDQLQTFEHHFSVRQITAYAVPSGDYGLSGPNPVGGAALAPSSALTLTADGAKAFPYLNRVATDPTQSTWAYEGRPLAGAKVDTLVSGPNSSSLLGIYTSSDGRETMFQTFNENQYYLQSELLRHGELEWLARGTYFGDQRNYLETDVDDTFLSDDSWSATTHSTDFNPADALREVPGDVTQAGNWSRANNFRIDMLFNGGGSVAVADGDSLVGAGDNSSGTTGSTGTTGGSGSCSTSTPCPDPLLSAFQETDPTTGKPYTDDFGWISHTWDHPNIDEGCATQNYIEAELNQNTTWGSTAADAGNPIAGGLGLTASTDPTAALGSENPNVVITGEHSGIANLLPGNPGQVDPPSLDSAVAADTTTPTAGKLAAGEYVYAVTDQFNTAAPGAPPVAGTGESAGSVSSPVTVTSPNNSVTLTWGAVCHAADYKIYRATYAPPIAPATTGTIGAWSQIGTVQANTTTDFTNPNGNSTTNTAGGGAVEKTLTDTGAAVNAGTPPTVGTADESAYEQNPALDAAFAGTQDGGIKYFGSDASKPYPNPANGSFATGDYTGAEYPAGAGFTDAGGTAIPRYPTNIYYNVSTNAQEVDEYQTLYDSPTCVPITGVTTCNQAGTTFTIDQIVGSVDQGMFAHLMGNDPRPTYFHQTNLMSQTSGTVNGEGNGLFYETLNPLLAEYHQYFASNAPIEQYTMAQIGTLLGEQSGWATAGGNRVTGYISGNQVTVNNGASAIEIPLTGVTSVGSDYEGSRSGWTNAPTGVSRYAALAAWPAPPTGPPILTPPKGPAPSGPLAGTGTRTTLLAYVAVQTTPKTVGIKRGKVMKVTVSLKCQATRGKTAKGKVCSGRFTLTVSGRKVGHSFRFKSGKVDRVSVTLPAAVRKAITARRRRHKHPKLKGKLVIVTTLTKKTSYTARGTLTIKT